MTTFNINKLTLALLATLSSSAIAQNQLAKKTSDTETLEIERIITTGSRIKRTDIEGVVNVTTITSSDMIKNGFNNVYDALTNLTQSNGALIGEVETGSYTPGAKEINLLGIGPEYTLVLINGKRLAQYPMPFNGQTNFVNMDMIPTSMVERIDIQTGGASAIYGSDAMAGVINIITKKGIEGNFIDIEGGVDTYGSNRNASISLVGGFEENKWTLDYALEYKKNDGLKGYDRPYHDSAWDNPSDTYNYELNRSITVYSRNTPTVNNYAEQFCNTEENPHSKAVLHYIARNNYGASCGWDETGENHLINKNETYSAYVNTEYHFNDDLSFFANGFYIDQIKQGTRGTLLFSDTEFFDPDLIDKNGNQGAPVQYMWRKLLDSEYTSDGMGRTFDDNSFSINLGFIGNLKEFDYSISYTRSEYNFSDRYVQATVEGLKKVLGTQYGTQNGLPVHRPDYATWFRSWDHTTAMQYVDWVTYQGNSFSDTLTADLAGDLFELEAGPVAFSLYAEYLKEGTEAIPDSRVLNKEFAGLTGLISKGERDRYAIAGEVLVPVTEQIDIEAAMRYDYYDDASNVGGAPSYQLGLSYTPLESLMFRAAYGTTFRGPDMAAVYKGFSGNFTTTDDRFLADACFTFDQSGDAGIYNPDALTISCADADLSDPNKPALSTNHDALSKGDKTLKEEFGNTLTLGFVYEFSKAFSVNLDYYDITIKDKVEQLSAGYIVSVNYDCQQGVYDPTSALCQNMAERITRFDQDGQAVDYLGKLDTGLPYQIHEVTEGYINASERQDAGINFGVKGLYSSDYGDFTYKFDANNVLKKKERLRSGDELLNLINDQNNFDFKLIANLSLGWQKENTAVNLFINHKGKLWNNADYGQRVKLPAWTKTNFTLAQNINQQSRLIFAITNLFNAMPPQDETFDNYPYYRTGAYDTLGRQFSLRFTTEF